MAENEEVVLSEIIKLPVNRVLEYGENTISREAGTISMQKYSM